MALAALKLAMQTGWLLTHRVPPASACDYGPMRLCPVRTVLLSTILLLNTKDATTRKMQK